MPKKQIFIVTDTETTKKDGLVFDVGWTSIDRMGRVYGTGSYIFKDVLSKDNPWYKHKIASYWEMAYTQKIEPVLFGDFRGKYNAHLNTLREDNYDPIVCAYNAGFDTRHLSDTSLKMTGERFLEMPVKMMCIWEAWAISCPLSYTAEISDAGNIRTRAEDVYKFESQIADFVEAHTGFEDTQIEAQILLRVLARKKKLPIVSHPSQFNGQPWRMVQTRVNKPKQATLPL